jgi:hypothetical protein
VNPAFTVSGLTAYTTYDVRVSAHSQYSAVDTNTEYWSDPSPVTAIKTAESTPGPVASPVATAQSAYDIKVLFETPEDPEGNIIQYKVALLINGGDASTAATQHIICDSSATDQCADAKITHTFGGLSANTLYDVTIVASTSAGEGIETSLQTLTLEAAPEEPAAPTVQSDTGSIGSTHVNIEWVAPAAAQANGDITAYTVYISPMTDEMDGLGAVSSGVGTTREITGLLPSTQYTITISASTGTGESVVSDELVVNTNQAAPDQQDAPIGIPLSAESFRAQWDPPAVSNGRIIGYTFKYVEVGNADAGVQYINTSAAEDFVEILGLRPATYYNLSVQCYNSLAASEYSNSSLVLTYESAPSAVQVSALSTSKSSIALSWTAPTEPNGEVTLYKVYQLSESQYVRNYPAYEQVETKLLKNASADEFSYVHSGASPHMTYRFGVSACNAAACSPLSFVAQTTTFESIPVNQYAPTVKILGATEATLRWSKPQYPNGEIIKYEVHKEQFDDETPSFSGIPVDVTDGKLSVTLTDLTPDTVYRFTVTSFTSQGPSERSAETPGSTESQNPSSRIATLVAVISIFVVVLAIGFMWEHRLRRSNVDVLPNKMNKGGGPMGTQQQLPMGMQQQLPMAEIPGTFSQERQLNNPFAAMGGVGRERSDSQSSGSSSGSSYGEAEA